MEKKIEFYMTAGIATDMDSDISFASEIGSIIHQFINDDWGTLCKEDCESNEQANHSPLRMQRLGRPLQR